MLDDSFFGTDAQQALLRRGRALYDLLQDAPNISYYGRTVGLLRPEPGSLDTLERLIAIQGSSTYSDLTREEASALRLELDARGYSVTRYDAWEGDDDALKAARRVLSSHALPEDIRVVTLDADAAETDLAALAGVALSCGVLPIAGSMLRGQTRPGVGLVALDANGRAVCCAAAAAFARDDDPKRGDQCWWGMLATDPDRRGQKLALILGALAMQQMHQRFGFASFMTGVQPGNTPSEAVCRASGLEDRGRAILTVVDSAVLPGGKLTS
jgi:hypothetical protein